MLISTRDFTLLTAGHITVNELRETAWVDLGTGGAQPPAALPGNIGAREDMDGSSHVKGLMHYDEHDDPPPQELLR